MKKYVYSFGNGTADGDGKMKDTLGGKGAGLAEMCRAKLPVPPGFTISTEVCNIYFQNKNAVPAEIDEQMLEALADARRAHGPEARRCRQPAAGERALGRQVLHAGHDGHHSQPRPERRNREGARKPRATIRASPTIATAASSRCSATWCWKSAKHDFDDSLRRPEEEGQGQARYRSDRRRSAAGHRRLQEAGAEEDRQAVPAGRHGAACMARATPCSAPGSTTAPSTTAR